MSPLVIDHPGDSQPLTAPGARREADSRDNQRILKKTLEAIERARVSTRERGNKNQQFVAQMNHKVAKTIIQEKPLQERFDEWLSKKMDLELKNIQDGFAHLNEDSGIFTLLDRYFEAEWDLAYTQIERDHEFGKMGIYATRRNNIIHTLVGNLVSTLMKDFGFQLEEGVHDQFVKIFERYYTQWQKKKEDTLYQARIIQE